MATVRTVPLTGFVCHSPSVIFAVSLAGRLELDMRLSPHTSLVCPPCARLILFVRRLPLSSKEGSVSERTPRPH